MIRNNKVIVLKASVNSGTPRTAENGGQRQQYRGGSAEHDDPRDDEPVALRCQEQRQRQPDENAVEAIEPGVDGAAIEAQCVCRER